MASQQRFLDTPAGKGVAVALVVVGIGAMVYMLHGSGGAAAIANTRIFVDSATGKPFNAELKTGMNVPIPAPSGGNTGYPAELCYWTADGNAQTDPTPVLLNTWIGKPEPTFCPICHRLVVPHNPGPGPGVKPPPTEAEYKSRGLSERGTR